MEKEQIIESIVNELNECFQTGPVDSPITEVVEVDTTERQTITIQFTYSVNKDKVSLFNGEFK